MEENDRIHLAEAIRLARENAMMGGGPFGALVVRDNEVISTGVNRVTLHHDPTAHAEVQAIRKAGEVLGTHELFGCTLYSSCEPCPMCLGAAYWARVGRVVFASDRNDAEKAGFRDASLYLEISLPPEARSIPFRQIKILGAGEEFKTWLKHPGRIEY